MEQRSDKKIGWWIFLPAWICAEVILTLTVLIFALISWQKSGDMREELLVIYPEKSAAMEDTFAYYLGDVAMTFLVFWAVLSSLLALVMIASYCLYHRRNKLEHRQFIQMEQELRKQQEREAYYKILGERLHQEEDSTKALITDISHQLKTPLSSLRMSHELAQEKNLSWEEHEEFLRQEEQEIQRLENLLDELVKLSRLESHMIQISPVVTGIRRTLTEAVTQVFMKAHSKNIELSVEMEEEGGTITARKRSSQGTVFRITLPLR